ncbi:hypothetical protein NQ317_006388 [Molorchus minor]|uniref:Sulfotransferase domain-containing protein n=1 Tax=Molorchus minor TaxID=1323400 RepID=A0ABQ9J4A8_9CUCU|nr:hypothetical protein NQ317_006388 [Molorchus minor]
MSPARTESRRGCVRPPHFDILWLPKAALRSVENDPSDCILVVGVSRPKMALTIMTVILVSLFLTFHMIYDSALNSLQTKTVEHPRPPILLLSRRLYPAASRRLPQAIIMGVRKCGTRALLEMLYLHPMVQKAAGEVHFFDRDDNYNKGLEWYRMQMPHSYPGQITIEKSPSYFVTSEVSSSRTYSCHECQRETPVNSAGARYKSDIRLHPVEGQRSHCLPALPTPPPKSFEQLALFPNGSINEAYRPLAISVYHNYLHRWLEVFPREQMLIVNGDLLIEDPVSQLQKIERFLGLEARIGTHNFYFNETKGFYCLRNETSDRCLRETKGRRHPRVDPEVVSKLRRYFGEHNQKFYELVGEDLGWPEE